MSLPSKRNSQSAQFAKMGEMITKVAASAIREAVKSSKASKGITVKASPSKKQK